jgi:hypothetical protein
MTVHMRLTPSGAKLDSAGGPSGLREADNYSFHTGNATCHREEKSRISTRTGFLVGTRDRSGLLINNSDLPILNDR